MVMYILSIIITLVFIYGTCKIAIDIKRGDYNALFALIVIFVGTIVFMENAIKYYCKLFM